MRLPGYRTLGQRSVVPPPFAVFTEHYSAIEGQAGMERRGGSSTVVRGGRRGGTEPKVFTSGRIRGFQDEDRILPHPGSATGAVRPYHNQSTCDRLPSIDHDPRFSLPMLFFSFRR